MEWLASWRFRRWSQARFSPRGNKLAKRTAGQIDPASSLQLEVDAWLYGSGGRLFARPGAGGQWDGLGGGSRHRAIQSGPGIRDLCLVFCDRLVFRSTSQEFGGAAQGIIPLCERWSPRSTRSATTARIVVQPSSLLWCSTCSSNPKYSRRDSIFRRRYSAR